MRIAPTLAALLLLALLPGPWAMAATSAPAPDPSVRAAGHCLAHRLLNDIEEAVARVEPWLQRYGYGAVFVLVGVEGFGIPAPGQTILEAGAAASTVTGSRLHIQWVLLTAFLATFLGAALGFLIGRVGGRGLLSRLHIPERHLERVELRFNRYGGWLILFARFFDGPRQLHGIAAGILGMPWQRFLVFNLAGAALWACFWGLLVYYLDLHLDHLVGLIRSLNPWVAVTTLMLLIVLVRLLWVKSGHQQRVIGRGPPGSRFGRLEPEHEIDGHQGPQPVQHLGDHGPSSGEPRSPPEPKGSTGKAQP